MQVAKTRRRSLLLLAMVFLLPCACHRSVEVANDNQLALAANAKVAGSKVISLKKPIDLTGMSVEQITGVRKQLVEANGELLQNGYTSWPRLFAKISSSSLWVSLLGLHFDGLDHMCGTGESYESLSLINPFILVSPHFSGFSKLNSAFDWDLTKVNRQMASQVDFPLYPKPTSLEWNAKESSAKLTFNISQYISSIKPFQKNNLLGSNIVFHLIAYNAADFNFHFLSYDPENTRNISFGHPAATAVFIRDIVADRRILRDNQITCNSATFPRDEMRDLKIITLPAQLTTFLWRTKPTDQNAVPDMKFTIVFD